LVIQPWNPSHGIFLTGKSTISFGSMAAKKQTIIVSPTSSRVSVRFDLDGLKQISAALENTQIRTAEDNIFVAENLGFHFRLPDTGPTMKPTEANDLIEPTLAEVAILLRGFGRSGSSTKGNVDINLTPRGQVALKLESNALERWRDSGGTVDLDSLNILWQGKTMTADGSLTLDENFKPLGAMTIKVSDGEPLGDFLTEMGWAKRRAANEISKWIKTWGPRNSTGDVVNIPVMIQDGIVSVGGATLGKLGPIINP